MQNPSTLASALVTKLKAISTLVTALGGSASAISAYEDTFPTSQLIDLAIFEQPHPSILVAWTGTATDKKGRWAHEFSLALKASGAYTTLFAAIANGVPSGGDGQPFRRTVIDASCYPIFGTLAAHRKVLITGPDTALEYFEVTLTLIEKGAD